MNKNIFFSKKMGDVEIYIQSQESCRTLLSVINLVCEISEGSKNNKGEDKHVYAVQMFQTVISELRRRNKISETLYFQCKALTPDDVGNAISDTIVLWNRVVPLWKRLWRSLRLCRK